MLAMISSASSPSSHKISQPTFFKSSASPSLKSVNFPKERVDLHLGYEELKRYKFGQLQFNPKIRLILVGPMPHSVSGKDEFSSIISMMERTEGFTKIKRLMNGSELKINKTNLKISVQEEIDSGYLVV